MKKSITRQSIEDCKILIDQLIKFKRNHGFNPFDNYKYREVFSLDKILPIDESLELIVGRTGSDFSNKNTTLGEIKSCKTKKLIKSGLYSTSNGHFEFDKQNDEIRRIETQSYESFIFSVWDENEEIICLFYFIEKPTRLIEAIKIKQNAFIEKNKILEEIGKRAPRDSISFNIKEIISFADERTIIVNQYGQKISPQEIGGVFKC